RSPRDHLTRPKQASQEREIQNANPLAGQIIKKNIGVTVAVGFTEVHGQFEQAVSAVFGQTCSK
ncbi:hypothetical protein, partial [Streptomyces sp. NPDC127574]|uniref:hypothetical protein n=1 Tax=Streptomyces sp. NPDC127574 TaxID=3345401 RepID=UPI00362B7ED0